MEQLNGELVRCVIMLFNIKLWLITTVCVVKKVSPT